jgi:DNA topoisomerase-1
VPKRLVIVESPAKARTIAGYLGPDFIVESSVGHIRDLPDSAAEIPEQYKGESWARLGVDVEHEFEPLYVVDPDKKKTVAQLKKHLADADELLLATDCTRPADSRGMTFFHSPGETS